MFDAVVDFTESQSESAPATPAYCPSGLIGARYCTPAVPNSTGQPAVVWALGSTSLADDSLVLAATDLPPGKFGYFVTGMGTGTVTPPGAQGVLCLTGASIHRYTKQIQSAGPGGAFSIVADVNAIPSHGPIQTGETWNFQAWFRDNNGGSTSNFTDAVAVTFLP